MIDLKSIAVKPRWIYSNKNSNKRSLPDLIEFDLELESDNITLNLLKQSTESNKPPLIITESEGQSSKFKVWKHHENEVSSCIMKHNMIFNRYLLL